MKPSVRIAISNMRLDNPLIPFPMLSPTRAAGKRIYSTLLTPLKIPTRFIVRLPDSVDESIKTP